MKRVIGGFLLSVTPLISLSAAADDARESSIVSQVVVAAVAEDLESRPQLASNRTLIAFPEPISLYEEFRLDGTRVVRQATSVVGKLYDDHCVVGTGADEPEDTIDAIVDAVKSHPCAAAAFTGGAAIVRFSNAAARGDIDQDELAKSIRGCTRACNEVSQKWASMMIDAVKPGRVAILGLFSMVAGIYDIFSGDDPFFPVLFDYLGITGSSEPQSGA